MSNNADTILNRESITGILGFHPAYLMLDRVQSGENPEIPLIGVKEVSQNEPYFKGHFPDHPVVPGVLQIESMFQLAIICCRRQRPGLNGLPYLSRIQRAKFRKPANPGDRLLVKLTRINWEQEVAHLDAAVHINEELASEAKLTIRFLAHPEDALRLKAGEGEPVTGCKPPHAGATAHDIEEIIPHRHPFLLIDEVFYRTDPVTDHAMGVYGVKNIAADETHILNRYGTISFLPCSLLIEMIAQMGCVIMLLRPNNKGKLVFFMGIDDAQFHRPIITGDRLLIDGDIKTNRDRFGKGMGKIYVGDEIVAEGHFKFAAGTS